MDEETVKIIDKVDKKEEEPTVQNGRMENYMRITAIATSIIVMAIFSLLLYSIRGVLVVFVLSFLAAYILGPVVRFFEKRKINRVLIVVVLYVVFVTAVVIAITLLLPLIWGELRDLQEGIQTSLSDPELAKNVSETLASIQNRLAKTFPQLENVDILSQFDLDQGIKGIASWILDYVGGIAKAITAYSGRVIWVIIFTILIPFITFFLLKDGRSITRAVLKIIPKKYSGMSMELMQKIDLQIGRYIRGRILESLVLSVLTIIGLSILRIKYYLVLGSIAGFANLIPYIGPVGIAIPAVLMAAYQYGMLRMTLTIIFLSSLQVVDNAILVPFIVGKSVDLHPIVTIFVVIVGGQLLGLLGMIIAVPLTSILIAVFQAFYKEIRGYSAPA